MDKDREGQRVKRQVALKIQRQEEKKQKRNAMKSRKNNSKKHQFTLDDWQELQKEERMIKKLKKGKISQKEFDEELSEEEDF